MSGWIKVSDEKPDDAVWIAWVCDRGYKHLGSKHYDHLHRQGKRRS